MLCAPGLLSTCKGLPFGSLQAGERGHGRRVPRAQSHGKFHESRIRDKRAKLIADAGKTLTVAKDGTEKTWEASPTAVPRPAYRERGRRQAVDAARRQA